jgi:hypothetical protein
VRKSLPRGEQKRQNLGVKQWEIIADNLHKAGFSLGWVSAWILKGERSGLLTRTATTESVLSCEPMKS